MSPRTKSFLKLCFFSSVCLLLISGCEQKNSRLGRPLTANEKRGEKLFIANCQKCHQPDNGLATQGPPLEGMFSKQFLPSGAPANDERVQNVIQYGRRTMLAFGQVLDDSQVRDIIVYLHTQ